MSVPAPTRAARLTRRGGWAVLVAAGLLLPASGAGADTGTASAASRAVELQAEVRVLERDVAGAVSAYQEAVTALATSGTLAIEADQRADAASALAASAERQHHIRARTLYMSGGDTGVLAALLSATTPSQMLAGLTYAASALDAGAEATTAARTSATASMRVAAAADTTANRSVATARDVASRRATAQHHLAAARTRLDHLHATARRLAAREQAAAARAAAERASTTLREAAAAAADTAPLEAARPATAPADYAALYRAAAGTCSGLHWAVLSAVGQVESGHGRNPGVSSAGAQGPMQFLPRTFAAYGVDGDGDGRTDIQSPADAVFSAANYLCATGAGNPATLPRAI